jgi:hypothetical protein
MRKRSNALLRGEILFSAQSFIRVFAYLGVLYYLACIEEEN